MPIIPLHRKSHAINASMIKSHAAIGYDTNSEAIRISIIISNRISGACSTSNLVLRRPKRPPISNGATSTSDASKPSWACSACSSCGTHRASRTSRSLWTGYPRARLPSSSFWSGDAGRSSRTLSWRSRRAAGPSSTSNAGGSCCTLAGRARRPYVTSNTSGPNRPCRARRASWASNTGRTGHTSGTNPPNHRTK